MDNVFAQRLVLARKIRCISQRDLAKALEISASSIEKYEKGEMMPSSSVLIQISNVLGMNIDYFFRPFTLNIDTSKFEFRKKSNLGAKKIESIKYFICSEIEKYIEIESIIGNQYSFRLDYSNTTTENEEQAKLLAKRFRKDLNIGQDAIVSAVELLENCGIKIIEIDEDDKFSGTCIVVSDIPVIVINKNMTSERKRLTAFHELGHLLMKCDEGVDAEKLCNIFANEVLIPSENFIRLIGASRHDISLIELQSIQKEYGISIDALMAKAFQLNIITKNRYTTYHVKKNSIPELRDKINESRYRAEETNRFERQVYRALASEAISTSKAASLLNIPVNDVLNNLNLM